VYPVRQASAGYLPIHPELRAGAQGRLNLSLN
jgi:hypothetical protein